jgi:hypothetical protein
MRGNNKGNNKSIELTINGIKNLYEKQYQGSFFQMLDIQPVASKPPNAQSTSTESIQMDKYRCPSPPLFFCFVKN